MEAFWATQFGHSHIKRFDWNWSFKVMLLLLIVYLSLKSQSDSHRFSWQAQFVVLLFPARHRGSELENQDKAITLHHQVWLSILSSSAILLVLNQIFSNRTHTLLKADLSVHRKCFRNLSREMLENLRQTFVFYKCFNLKGLVVIRSECDTKPKMWVSTIN